MCPSPHNCKLDQHYYDSPKRGPSLWLPHSDTPWITSISARCSRWRWCIGASNSRESGSLSFVHSRHTRVHYACNMCLPPRPVSRRAMGTTIIATSFRDNNVPIMTMLLRLPTLWPRPRRVVGWIALFSSWKSIGTPCGGREGNKAKIAFGSQWCVLLFDFLSKLLHRLFVVTWGLKKQSLPMAEESSLRIHWFGQCAAGAYACVRALRH